jgi:hypothetical protein
MRDDPRPMQAHEASLSPPVFDDREAAIYVSDIC